MDVIELANHLRLEHLFITNEKQQLQKLNEKLIKYTEDAFHISWIRQKQRCNLQNLVQSQDNDLNAIMISNAINENVDFIDSYKRLSNQTQLYSDLLSSLRKNPKIIALSLIEIEQHCLPSELQAICSSIFSSLYCDCILPEDQQLTLLLLKELVNHQLVVSENPLKLIRNGNCVFKIFFKLFTESLTSCKFFLSSSLKDCLFNCLMEDELYLDLEIERATMRYTDEERQRLFGSPSDTENYQAKLSKFRARVLEKLSVLIINFVDTIQQNIHCFPSILFSLFRHTYQRLHNSRSIDEKEAGIVCTDLIFAQFICHAILNPELYGIVDINITKMARYNLTQIAHILQVIALNKWQEIDPKLNELIVKIPKKYCFKNFLQVVMQNEPKIMLNSAQFNQSLFFNSLSTITNEIKRTCILFSENDLYHFLKMLFQVKNKTTNQYLKKVLDDFLKYLNENNLEKILNPGYHMNNSDYKSATVNSEDQQSITESNNNKMQSNQPSSKKSILDKMTRRSKNQEVDSSHSKEESLLNKMTKRSNSKTHLINNNTKDEVNVDSGSTRQSFLNYNNLSLKNNNFQVLVIPILSNHHHALFNDILSEEKVLNIESLRKTRTKTKLSLESNQPNIIPSNVSNIQQSQINLVANSLNNYVTYGELDDKASNVNNQTVDNKRSKFNSLSQDQESIGTNDNLEAISEASSMENLNDNLLIEGDNLSDTFFMSSGRQTPNVSSGRVTPNVSGRESSSSESSDEEDEPTANPANQNNEEVVAQQVNDQSERQSVNPSNQNVDQPMNDNQNNNNLVQANNQNAQSNHMNNNNNHVQNRINQQENNRLIVQQRTHEYIEDKFGKFDYKQIVVTQPATDETKSNSHLSDTWSTDVLASLSSISLISSQLNDTNIPNQLTETINYEFCKKLFRNVFSIVDIQNMPLHCSLINRASITNFHHLSSNGLTVQNRLAEVQNLLQLLLAEAKYMQNMSHSIAIQEALRYLNNFDESLFNKMMQELKDDYQKRSPYIAYLCKCKQNLIKTIQHFQTIKQYLDQDKNTINNCLITFYVRKFLMKNMNEIDNFVNKFKQLVLADEKANLIDEFLIELYSRMEQDPDWKYTSEEQTLYGKTVVERNIFSTIYYNAIYPNLEGDIHRDQIFHKHIQNLSKNITPDHKDLKIPRIHLNQCPWPQAQEQISKLNAYRTPKDKVNCVFNCCSVIMNLLSLCEKSVPAADDLMPVLVYVIIKANPSSLLSTIEFIKTYYEDKLEGEQLYWWTQFVSAVFFVKNMDY